MCCVVFVAGLLLFCNCLIVFVLYVFLKDLPAALPSSKRNLRGDELAIELFV